MAAIHENLRKNIDALVAQWRERCLIEDGSLLREEELWTADRLRRIYTNVVDSPLADARSFMEKLKAQMAGDRELTLLASEALIVYYLFASVSAVSVNTKRRRVNEVLGWVGEQLPKDSSAWRALGDRGIGHPGQFFLLRPDAQLGFIVDFSARLKDHAVDERRAILDDPVRLREFADEHESEGTGTMRHIVLYLLHPEHYERISSSDHKHSIATTFAGLLPDGEIEDVDEQLLRIRLELSKLIGKPSAELDFYRPPLLGTWGAPRAEQGLDPIDALELKRQVVLFGPPGTSKTYEAKQLAAQIIRRKALVSWGPVEYFRKRERIEELVATHVRRLQLHPAYSYEEFIRGLRLRDGHVAYEDGYLLRLIEEIETEQLPDGEPQLPWVLVLDELNRADLSRVFGEAFSVLEDRDSPVDLPGRERGEPPATIQLPEHLYVIGTMNLIDQSLEQIDFALRRRFLWRRSGFDAQRLAEVLLELWGEHEISRRYPWSNVADDMELFRERAELLNDHVAQSPLLGRDYEIGHTYFFDIVGLLGRAEYMNRKQRASRYLWTAKREARPAVANLWQMSLEPLLDQYLQGVDAESRKLELEKLGRVFLTGRP
jgi:5-methylcytosine-specific restriction protein B